MEEVVSVDVLDSDKPRVVAVTLCDARTGNELVKTTLIRVLATQQSVLRVLRKDYGVERVFCVQAWKIVEFGGKNVAHSLRLAHHTKLFCTTGCIEHDVRCTRCKRAPIIGTRFHVRKFAADLCEHCADQSHANIRRLLQPVYFPAVIHEGVWSVQKNHSLYSSVRDWLKSVDGPYSTDAEVDDALAQGAKPIDKDSFVAWKWPDSHACTSSKHLWAVCKEATSDE